MLDINGAAAAMGEDAIYPRASILHAGNSSHELDSGKSPGNSQQHADNNDKQSDVQDNNYNMRGAGSQEDQSDDGSVGDRICSTVSPLNLFKLA
jgi:hypothetical protein